MAARHGLDDGYSGGGFPARGDSQGRLGLGGRRLGDLPGALLHLVVYAILAWAFTLALWKGAGARLRSWALLGAFLLTTAYGAIDEYHQTFLPAHGGWPNDIGWDAVGAILALVPLQLAYRGNWGHSVRSGMAQHNTASAGVAATSRFQRPL